VETLKGRTDAGVEEDYHLVTDVQFFHGDRQRVLVSFRDHGDTYSRGTATIEYRRTTDAIWQVASRIKGVPEAGNGSLEVTVKQGLNEPPQLVAATGKQTSQVIWDPNPQLKDIDLGQATVYTWKDREGRDWRGGLFKPRDYKPGQRYPLVIQTHGFTESEFIPSGVFPTAFAARALAATGIVVLQVQDLGCLLSSSPSNEAGCAVSGYESVVNQLISEGLVDPERIGIIGFSRTCFYVMEALTTGSLRLKVASITDGFMVNYLQYMMSAGDGGRLAHEADSIIGARPFGEGLQQWLKRSPVFNLDKIGSPLLVVGEGPVSLLFMWEPYAGLRYLHKPVDLVMLNTDEHVLTNPAVRMASQGGSVDWFRFWLKDEEDADPAKAEQYVRWRELRKLQEANDNKPAVR
jgi:dipeptidyl aminopeptidase/acylaminoacyl peptidase